MTYTALVRGSSPVGYWKLNGSGSAIVGASATVSNGAWTAPPLVVNSGSSLLIKPLGASVSIYNPYDAFYKRHENKSFVFEMWFSFNGKFDGSGYRTNLDPATRYFTNNDLNIITIDTGSTQIGRLYYDYQTNTFRFGINGNSTNFDAYLPVRNLNNSFYIVAKYINGALSLNINGENGMAGNVGDTSLFPASTSSVYFNINGNSINPSSSINFVIGELAMYDSDLSMSEQRKRVLYALSADSPTYITRHLDTSYFDFFEKDYQVLSYENITGRNFELKKFDASNLVIGDDDGIRYRYIPPFTMADSAYSGSATVTASGLKYLSQNTALVFDRYGSFFDKERAATITCQITPTTASTSYVFSITNCVARNGSLYISAGSAGYTLGTYDPATASVSVTASVASTLNIGETYNVGICVVGNQVYFCTEDTVVSASVNDLDISMSSQLVIGNFSNYFTNNTLYMKNLSMNNEENQTFNSYDFTENKMFMARLTSDYSIGQISKWTKIIPLMDFGSDIVGSKITWDSMDNCIVETSDDGDYWYLAKRGKSISNIVYGQANQNKMLRVTVPYEYTTEQANQTFSGINIAIYRNLGFTSEDGKYTWTAFGDIATSPIYTIKRVPQSMLFRQSNFGVAFDSTSSSVDGSSIVNGYAVVAPTVSTASAYGMDMWFKPDSINTGSNFIFDASESSTASGPYLYINGSTNKLIYSPSTMNVYVNGASIASNSFTVSVGEFYHVTTNLGTMTNLLTDPSFQSGIAGMQWSSDGASVTITKITSDYYSGSSCMEITKGGYPDLWRNITAYDSISPASGTLYNFSAYIKVPAGNEKVNIQPGMFFYSSSAYIGGNNGSYYDISSACGWVRVTASAIVPAGTTISYVSFGWSSSTNTTGQKFLVDSALLENTDILNNYFEGKIPRYISSSITINGKKYSGSGTHSAATYGHLNIWSASVSANTASTRYNHFVSNNVSQVIDTPSTLWQSNWSSDSITTASAYRIG